MLLIDLLCLGTLGDAKFYRFASKCAMRCIVLHQNAFICQHVHYRAYTRGHVLQLYFALAGLVAAPFGWRMSQLASIPMKEGVGGAAAVSIEDDQDLSLATRLARFWAAADRTAFYALMVVEGIPNLRRIVSSGLNLPVSDAEDCVAEALEAFIERQDVVEVSDPYAYLARSSWNRGATLHRRRRHELVSSVEALSRPATTPVADGLVGRSTLAQGAWAVVAVEETLDDVEAEESWAVIVVEAALEKLTIKQRALVRYLSTLPFDFSRKDFDVQSRAAAAALGMKPAAFRKAKQRAYEALRASIPTAVTELGVRPPARFVAAFEETRGSFMDDQLDENES